MMASIEGQYLTQLPDGATVYTDQLAGATLDELLDAAEQRRWPALDLAAEWDLLRNWAIQFESVMLDEAENLAWEQRMRELAGRDMPYLEWVAERQSALDERTRARKLAQTRLRYAYGFKQKRRRGLIAKSVRAFYATWSDPGE